MKKAFSFLLVALLFGLFAPASHAKNAYHTYTYDSYQQAVHTAPAYTVEKIVASVEDGDVLFENPVDMVSKNGELFLLDAQSSKIVVFDQNLTVKRVITPHEEDNSTIAFGEALGIFICDDGRILVSSKKPGCVYILDENGLCLSKLTEPKSSLIPEGYYYEPIKAVEDNGGIIYVLSAGSYSGALQFDVNGAFLGFFGSEKVAVTPKVLINYFWKKVLTDEMTAGLERTLPVEFVSFDIDDGDFIYTIRRGNDVNSGQVRKLNARSQNVISEGVYGDYYTEALLTDITVHKSGFISILDNQNGKVFQYDKDGQLLFAFGGIGQQHGCFMNPVAIEEFNEKLLVLDSTKKTITAFKRTKFAEDIHSALLLYHDGEYQKAKPYWQDVLSADFRYELAGIGLGKAAEQKGDYVTAMKYYRIGVRRDLYSDAFSQMRAKTIRNLIPFIVPAFLAVVIVGMVLMKKRLARRVVYGGGRKAIKYPIYCLFHPFSGFEDLKYEKTTSKRISAFLLLCFFAVTVLTRQATGFIFNYNRIEKFNLIVAIITSLGLFFAFAIANYAITTISEGKGSFKEIVKFLSYALVPFIIGSSVCLVLSHAINMDEGVFYRMGVYITYVWTGWQILIALKEVHQYSFKRVIWTTGLTVISLVIMVILAAILYSVFSQLFSFIAVIYRELFL